VTVDLLTESFPSIAHARLAARDAGWHALPFADEWTEQVWARGLHRIRLTAVGRCWCWSAVPA
jgi:hypothetical protein